MIMKGSEASLCLPAPLILLPYRSRATTRSSKLRGPLVPDRHGCLVEHEASNIRRHVSTPIHILSLLIVLASVALFVASQVRVKLHLIFFTIDRNARRLCTTLSEYVSFHICYCKHLSHASWSGSWTPRTIVIVKRSRPSSWLPFVSSAIQT